MGVLARREKNVGTYSPRACLWRKALVVIAVCLSAQVSCSHPEILTFPGRVQQHRLQSWDLSNSGNSSGISKRCPGLCVCLRLRLACEIPCETSQRSPGMQLGIIKSNRLEGSDVRRRVGNVINENASPNLGAEIIVELIRCTSLRDSLVGSVLSLEVHVCGPISGLWYQQIVSLRSGRIPR